jgi:integrase
MSFSDSFKFEGRTYRLFKREQSKDANWYVHLQRRGLRYLRSLDTNVKENAIANAKVIIAAIKGENWETLESTKLHRQVATLGEVYAVYLAIDDERKSRTAKNNTLAMNALVRAVFPGKDPAGVSTAELTGQFVRAFKSAIDDEEDEDELEQQRAKRTANSYLRQARSIFAKHVLEHYEDAGLKLPDLRGFMEAVGFRKVGKSEYNPPGPELIRETFKRLDGDLRKEDAAAYAAICLACGTGMRKGEIGKAEWGWFQPREDGSVFIKSNRIAKNGTVIDVPVLSAWWKRLQAIRAEQLAAGGEQSFVLPGSSTERSSEVFRRVGAWMRKLGWKTEKTIHEFRAYVGSKVAEEHGIEIASAFLRHADLRTTKQFYMRYQQMRQIDVKDFSAAA